MDQPMLPGMEPEEDDVAALREHVRDMSMRFGRQSPQAREANAKFNAALKRQRKQEILDFDPNKDEDNLPQFASYCPTRSNGKAFKQHSQWHHATRAVKMHDGAVYKWNNLSNTWVRYEVWFEGKHLGR